MEALGELAIVLLILLITIAYFWRKKGAGVGGALPGGAIPPTTVDEFNNPPVLVDVGVNTTFDFKSFSVNPLAMPPAPSILPVSGREFYFTVTPAAVQIVSIGGDPINGSTGPGTTDANGEISIVIIANFIPSVEPDEEFPQGTVVGVAVVDTSIRVTAIFEIR